MGIMHNQESNRSELQRRLAAELSDKAKKKAKAAEELPDGVEDSAYIKGTKQTTSFAWIWVLIAVIAVAVVVWIFITSGNQQ